MPFDWLHMTSTLAQFVVPALLIAWTDRAKRR
jgi:hypothetical protein